MATVNAYLTFNGNCEEAFLFYKSVFGGDFAYVGRFSDMPPSDDNEPLLPEVAQKIMHINLPISNETILLGSDNIEGKYGKVVFGNNIALSINTASVSEADHIFNALAVGGTISMPLEKTFWNAYFGMLTDQFGIQWLVNYDFPLDK